jgi:hypothetical protein
MVEGTALLVLQRRHYDSSLPLPLAADDWLRLSKVSSCSGYTPAHPWTN